MARGARGGRGGRAETHQLACRPRAGRSDGVGVPSGQPAPCKGQRTLRITSAIRS